MRSSSAFETEKWGEELGARLGAGQFVALRGPLGAGKTTLIRGICRGLGVDVEEVSSPTFVLLQIYSGRVPVYHFDAYRLEGPRDLEEIGALDYFEGDGVCLVEWPERAEELLPVPRLEVTLEVVGPDEREIQLDSRD